MFKSKRKREEQAIEQRSRKPALTEEQREVLSRQQEQARRLRRLEAEWDVIGRRT